MSARLVRGRFARSELVVLSLAVMALSARIGAAQTSGWGFQPYNNQQTFQAYAPVKSYSPVAINSPAVGYYPSQPVYEVASRHHIGGMCPTGGCSTGACATGCSVGGYDCGCASAPVEYGPVMSGGYCDSGCCDTGVGCGSCYTNCCCPPPVRWLGSIGVLYLDRNDENQRTWSYDDADESYQLLDSRDSNFEWTPGIEGHLMRWDCCANRGCEIAYWGLYPDEQYAYAYPSQVAGNLNGIFNFDQLDYNGNLANLYVDNAMVHRLRRETEIHNIELNQIWAFPSSCGCSGWSFASLAGFRYFRLEDNLEFAADTIDTVFTGAVEELYYNIDTENNLYGLQFGAMANRALGSSRWSLTFGAKAGVFVNSAEAHSTIGGAAGIATINNGPNLGAAWDITSSDESVATIAELQAGVAYRCAHHWRLRGDFRVIGISGVALPTNQIYQDLRGIQDVQVLGNNGDLILHGFFAGIERNY